MNHAVCGYIEVGGRGKGEGGRGEVPNSFKLPKLRRTHIDLK